MNESEELWKLEEVAQVMEQQQLEIQNLNMMISEKDKTISESSSENSMLKKELQKKSKKIEKLNESDLILKDNQRLKRELKQLTIKNQDIEGKCKDYECQRLADNEAWSRLEKCSIKIKRLETCSCVVLLYGIVVTLMTAIRSTKFMNDFIQTCYLIKDVILTIWKMAIQFANIIATVSENINIEWLEVVARILGRVLGFISVIAIGYGILGYCLYKAGKFYFEEFWDMQSLASILIMLVLMVWMADGIGSVIKWNVFIVFVIGQGLYLFIRMCLNRAY